ncbi:M91 family zinc metallopeptidase [Pseudomonas sp. NPDC089396]|uniref:M91 family zinc metallopeptidase n=1 Tax=Pseudomonas sp. NPDC089396 TaxID=3364461 RepID=UPI003832773C
MNPNPTYFISGRTSGFQQWKEKLSPDKEIHKLLVHRDDQLDIYLEQIRFKEGQFPSRFHMVLESRFAGATIDLSPYDCHLQAIVDSKRFILAPTPETTLIIKAADGNTQVNVQDDVDIPLIIQIGSGNSSVKTGSGITEVFTGTGDFHIEVGKGLAFIKSDSANCRITGHILIDNPHASGTYARSQPGDERFAAPLEPPFDTLANSTFEVAGSDTFKQAVDNHLIFLRHTHCGQQLLAELARRSGIKITETEGVTQFEVHVTDPTDEDHHLQRNSQGQWVAGWPAEGGNLALNLTRSDSDNLPLLDFYRCLCEAYNAFNGTTMPDSIATETYDLRLIQVARANLQAIGLAAGISYDFDNDPSTPPTETNPSQFTENGLRLELGLQPRHYY